MGDTPKLDPRIIGFTRNGRPIFSIAGGAPEDDGAGGESDDKDGDDGKGGSGDGGTDKGADGKGGTEPDYKAEADKWKALARKHEGNAKTNADAAKRLKEIEDSDKSEIEKATERAAEAERKAADAEGRALRLEVAHEKGLTPSLARRLVGTTKEELEADADELLESVKPDDGKGGGGKGPRTGVKEKLRGGSEPDEEPEEKDPRKLAAKIPRNE